MPKKTDKKIARKPALKDLEVPKAQGAKVKGGMSIIDRADNVATKAIKRVRNRQP